VKLASRELFDPLRRIVVSPSVVDREADQMLSDLSLARLLATV
jgi:hypothetical protein